MLLNNFVNLRHQSNCLRQRDDNLLVVGNVVRGQNAAFTILQPLLADLVSADVEVPYGLGYTPKAGGLRFIYEHGIARPRDFFDLEVWDADEIGNGMA